MRNEPNPRHSADSTNPRTGTACRGRTGIGFVSHFWVRPRAEIGFVSHFLCRGGSPAERPGLNLWRHASAFASLRRARLRAILFVWARFVTPPVFGAALSLTDGVHYTIKFGRCPILNKIHHEGTKEKGGFGLRGKRGSPPVEPGG